MIEKTDKISFEQHLQDVKGERVPAPPEKIKALEEQFAKRINKLLDEIDKCSTNKTEFDAKIQPLEKETKNFKQNLIPASKNKVKDLAEKYHDAKLKEIKELKANLEAQSKKEQDGLKDMQSQIDMLKEKLEKLSKQANDRLSELKKQSAADLIKNPSTGSFIESTNNSGVPVTVDAELQDLLWKLKATYDMIQTYESNYDAKEWEYLNGEKQRNENFEKTLRTSQKEIDVVESSLKEIGVETIFNTFITWFGKTPEEYEYRTKAFRGLILSGPICSGCTETYADIVEDTENFVDLVKELKNTFINSPKEKAKYELKEYYKKDAETMFQLVEERLRKSNNHK